MTKDIIDIEEGPNWIVRTGRDSLEVLFLDGERATITWAPCPELGPGRWGFRVNGEFQWTDNPFWMGDMMCDIQELGSLKIGEALFYEGVN